MQAICVLEQVESESWQLRGLQKTQQSCESAQKVGKTRRATSCAICEGGSMSNHESPGLTRRSFLKTTVAATGTAVLAGSVLQGCSSIGTKTNIGGAESTDEAIYYGQCRGNCCGGCRLKIKVRDNKVVQTEMAETTLSEYNRICTKGLSWPQRTYSPDRILYPMRQTGKRGSNNWEQITWDEAISLITEKWKTITESRGGSSICFSPGSGSFGKSSATYSMLSTLMGASRTVSGYDASGLAMVFKTIGFDGFLMANTPNSDAKAKTILVVGGNATDSVVQNFHFLLDAKENGATLIHIDPTYNMTSAKSDWFIPIRPGSDGALFLTMINICIKNDWIDTDYLLKATVAPYLVKKSDGKFLRGSDIGAQPTESPTDSSTDQPSTGGTGSWADTVGVVTPSTGQSTVNSIQVWDTVTDQPGAAEATESPALTGHFTVGNEEVIPCYQLLVESVEEWTAERAARVCDIPAQDIEKLTRMYAAEGSSILWMGFGLDHYNGSHHAYHAAIELMAITGQFGGMGKGMAGAFAANSPAILSNSNLAVTDSIPGPTISTVNLRRVIDSGMAGDIPVNLSSIFLYMHNMIPNLSDRQRTLEMLDKLDFIVVADLTLSETAQYADVLLPCCGWLELEDLAEGGSFPIINIQEKAIDPIGESKTDYEIVQLLAQGMGFGNCIPWTYEEYLSDYFENPLAQQIGLTLDVLREEKTILSYDEGTYIHGQNGVFPTATGKLEFYLEDVSHSAAWEGVDMGDKFDNNLEHLAHFDPPHEAWTETVEEFQQSEISKKYPIIFMSYRDRYRTHTQFFDCAWLKEIIPEPLLRLNPEDAANRNISEGDYVRAFNDRGEVVLKAVINSGIRSGIVVYLKGGQKREFKKGHCSDLTSIYTHPAMYNNYYFDTVCEIEKWEEE
jgi:molybdopterin-containing oxidoreductase family molybdopterin binding subunit